MRFYEDDSIMKRSEAREQAFLLLFEKSFKDEPIPDIIEDAKQARDYEDDAFIDQLVEGVLNHLTEVDDLIRENSTNWKLERVSRVTHTLLRLAVYEMLYEKEIPTGVSINEAVNLAKKFAGVEDSSYLNGVLGGISKKLS